MANRNNLVISVMDRDRPGIVAEVTEGISSLGGNLADLRESVLRGYFTMILVADFPAEVTVEQVQEALATGKTSHVSVESVTGTLDETERSEQVYILSAVAKDRVGLVAQVSRFCYDRSVNILDLASHVDGDQYTMMLQLEFSDTRSVKKFRSELSRFGEKSGLNLVLQHNDIFRATNEI
ncbi:glycine cleavage system protein R [Pontiella agarivorans]|uniref:ACT domain-containing protein n=1 Tax=Pontiella agarivorans TaxID=3038953 RepID=A0ABU5MZ35_9BACT|nr:ACT domain-containing protein [Pontiella agarivorans]MDZ8119469.1 ACT domain-containing protein [Pontiella agarivorans]